jgi:hypothetical protein
MRLFIIAMMLLCSTAANASSVTWTLSDVIFDDGGTANGSFTIDTESYEISDLNIYTTSGTAFAGDTYTIAHYDIGAPYPLVEFFTDNYPEQTNETALVLFLPDDFPYVYDHKDIPAGGTYTIDAREVLCPSEAFCGNNLVNIRSTVSVGQGSITGVPIPAAVWLFASALGGLGWIRRRRIA